MIDDQPTNDIAQMLARLHQLTGGDFSRMAEQIALRSEFHPLEGETGIYVCGGEGSADFANLLNAARKAVAHGYSTFILPNPKGIRTPDFILAKKGVYRVYDLKTIQGRASAGNRLTESIGQANNVLLNISTDYNPSVLAQQVKHYFETNPNANRVLIFKGHKEIVIDRALVLSRQYVKLFRKKYEK